MGFVQKVSFGEEDCPVMMQLIQNSYPSDQKYFESRKVGQPDETEKMKNSNEYINRPQLWS